MDLRVELATPDEAHLVHRTMREAYAEYDGMLDPPSGAVSESVADVAAAMAKGGAVLAWSDGAAIGSARFEWRADHVYVGRVAVVPAQRGKGVGSAIMARIEDVARSRAVTEIRLASRATLPRNLAFYGRLGYSITAIVPHEKGGAEVVWMTKTT